MTTNRLRACRKYLGFSPEEVARVLRTDARSVEAMEETGIARDEDLWRLAQLYRRTPGYLRGTESPPQVDAAVERMIASRAMSATDAGELRGFARCLAATR